MSKTVERKYDINKKIYNRFHFGSDLWLNENIYLIRHFFFMYFFHGNNFSPDFIASNAKAFIDFHNNIILYRL